MRGDRESGAEARQPEEGAAFPCDWCGQGIGWEECVYGSSEDELVCERCAAVADADQLGRLLFVFEVRQVLQVLVGGDARWWKNQLN